MTYLQEAMLRHGHPRRMIVGLISAIWAFYFLWFHNWVAALAAIGAGVAVGRIVTFRVNPGRLAETTLGKILLLHLSPANLLFQLAGVALLFYSMWTHSVEQMLTAICIVLLGHMWGWHKVNRAL